MEARALTVNPPGCYVAPSGCFRSRSYATTHRRGFSIPVNCLGEYPGEKLILKRRNVIITPFLAAGAYALRSAVARADEKLPMEGEASAPPVLNETTVSSQAEGDAAAAEEAEVASLRIYDATVIGEPLAMGREKSKVLEKMINAQIVYLGESEQVPIPDDKELELVIVKGLRRRCVDGRRLSLALQAFPSNLQEQLDQFVAMRIDEETLKSLVTDWPPQRWQEYEPLLTYCRDNGVRLIACGVPLEVNLKMSLLEDLKTRWTGCGASEDP